MVLHRWARIAVPLFLLAACQRQSIGDRIAAHDRALVSWRETARFVAEEWSARAVPSAFASRTLARTREELSKEMDALRKEPLPPDTVARLRAQLTNAESLTDSLERAVRTGDRVATRRP
jgi:hypothetical protein